MIKPSVFMMFRRQRQENCENENKNYKTALILSKNKNISRQNNNHDRDCTISSATIRTLVFVKRNVIILNIVPLC